MDQKIILKDGTEILNGVVSRMNDVLMVNVPGNDLVGVATLFSDPGKTLEIVFYYSVYKKTFFGFTQMYSVQYFADEDYVQVWLKGDTDSVSENSEYTVPEEYLPESMRTTQEEKEDGE